MSLKVKVVAHWKRMREDARGVFERDGEKPSGRNCDFCTHYKVTNRPMCEGCPIMIATGIFACRIGPYLEAQRAWTEYHDSGWDESQREWWVLKATDMITFLESLPNE